MSGNYPVMRYLDGVFFRVERDGRWTDVCYSDMTQQERDDVIGERSAGWWKSLAEILAEQLRSVGDLGDIVTCLKEPK